MIMVMNVIFTILCFSLLMMICSYVVLVLYEASDSVFCLDQ